MTLSPAAVLHAARDVLLAPDAVTDGWRGVAVDVEGDDVVVRFRWRELPYALQARFGPDDLAEGAWTGTPLLTPHEWAYEVSGFLMEELDTGGVAWAARRQRGEEVELLLDAPRVGALAPDRKPAYFVSTWPLGAVGFAAGKGFDVAPVRHAVEQDRLVSWWSAYVDNDRGEPYVAQLVVVRDDDVTARLEHLEVRPDLPGPVPDSVLAEMAYLAAFDAACRGMRRVVTDLDHPALRHVGGLRDVDGVLAWTADGPLLSPPDLEPATVPRGWDGDVGLAQSELSDDLEQVVADGERHPEAYGGVRFDGPRLLVAYTDPDAHRDRVRALVQHPDAVDVVRAPRTQQELRQVRDAVERVLEQHPHSWSGLGNAGDHLVLDLRASGLDVAEQLWREHGDAVAITVGGHDYPLDVEAVAAQRRYPGPEQTEPWPEGLVAEVVLARPATPVGDVVRGRLLLRATGTRVAFDSDQPLYGELLDDDGRRVNTVAGFRIGTGRDWDLRPGEQRDVEFSAETDSARLADGPFVAPGTWQLVLPVPVHRHTPNGLTTTHLVAGPFPVVLSAGSG
ncbi:MAG: hypothetical protein JWN17_2541 [Frankiales bacterium]|nr:hypothetical protein [Frankiales bacterium]